MEKEKTYYDTLMNLHVHDQDTGGRIWWLALYNSVIPMRLAEIAKLHKPRANDLCEPVTRNSTERGKTVIVMRLVCTCVYVDI